MRGSFGQKLKNCPKLPHIRVGLYCKTNGKVSFEKAYSLPDRSSTSLANHSFVSLLNRLANYLSLRNANTVLNYNVNSLFNRKANSLLHRRANSLLLYSAVVCLTAVQFFAFTCNANSLPNRNADFV